MTNSATVESAVTATQVAAWKPSAENRFKYSENLYKFLTHNLKAKSTLLQRSKVYQDEKGERWLGFFDDQGSFVGWRLNRALVDGKALTAFSYSGLGALRELPEFWAHYEADGRCAFDHAHSTPFGNDELRWLTTGSQRRCTWCGKVTQEEREVTRTVTTKEWATTAA